MYEKGLLSVALDCGHADCDCSVCDETGADRSVYDNRNADYVPGGSTNVVYLPHSCDSWVIGGVEQIDALIADLTEARRALAGEGK